MAIKMLVTDMDGTLLDSNRHISDVNKKTISKAVKDGLIFTVATGRMYKSALPYAKQLDIDVPIITYNGAMIKTISGKLIHVDHIAPEDVTAAVDFAAEIGQYIQVYDENEVYIKEPSAESEWYANAAGIKHIVVGEKLREYNKNIPKMLIICKDAADVPKYLEMFNEKFNGRLVGLNSDPTYIEIMAKGVSKANAMFKFAEMMKIEQKDILAMGDSGNDVSMIKAANFGVVVANATPTAKAAADYEVCSNNDNGVAEAINRFFYKK